MLTGTQLHILRFEYDIKPSYICERLKITPIELSTYESEMRNIPDQLYEQWIDIIRPYHNK